MSARNTSERSRQQFNPRRRDRMMGEINTPWEVRRINDGKRPWAIVGESLNNLDAVYTGELARFRKRVDAQLAAALMNARYATDEKSRLTHRAHVALWKLECAVDEVIEQWRIAAVDDEHPDMDEAIRDLMIPYRAAACVRRDLLMALEDPRPDA